ncbi:MAG: phosphoglycolate phosphatase, partial [Actinomycetia bacterium]|nr:phosphoglycolate phosphatase [Actinomycetes bacterium]
MVKGYSGYLFDLDGTLVDTAPDINAALNHALAVAGLNSVDESLTRHWVGHGGQVLVEQALRHQNGSDDLVTEVVRDFIEHYEAHIADLSRPYPDVVESLRALKQRGARLAVVTNKRTGLSVPLLQALDLAHLFHAVICGDTTARPKPAADPALHACAALGVDVADALFVGDSDSDVACARAAGCPVVVV